MEHRIPPPTSDDPPCVLLVGTDRVTHREFHDALGAHVGVVIVPTAFAALDLLRSGVPFDAIGFDLDTASASGATFYADVCAIHAPLGSRLIMIARPDAQAAWAEVAPLGLPAIAKPIDPSAVRAIFDRVVARAVVPVRDESRATTFARDAEALCGTAVAVLDDAPAKSPFGPFYPQPLQGAITHAERFSSAISGALDAILDSPAFDPNEPTDAEVWLLGRTEEVEAFVAEIVADWQRGRLRIEDAAGVLDRYIESMHRGMLASTSQRGPLPCCGALDLTSTTEVNHTTTTHEVFPTLAATPTPNNS